MSERKSRSQKRQRSERYTKYTKRKTEKEERIQAQLETEIQKLKLQHEAEEVKLAREKPCWINKTAEGVLCSIFTFLDTKNHFNLARTCAKLGKISIQWQASPTQVDLRLMQHKCVSILRAEAKAKILDRLVAFQPIRLTALLHAGSLGERGELAKLPEMTSLRELTLQRSLGQSSIDLVLIGRISQLTSLTNLVKLTIPDRCLLATTALPSSLTHLELLRTPSDGFSTFDSTVLFTSPHLRGLPALKVLKIPDIYCELQMLTISTICPLLRELTIGYFNVRNGAPVSLAQLQSCKHLEALTVGVDCGETIPQWESLATVPSLRRLTISIYQTSNPTSLFARLSQVTQLTHLQLVPHRDKADINISYTFPDMALSSDLPELTTLLISHELIVSNPACLSAFSTLQELMIPDDRPIKLPRLHTLHINNHNVGVLDHYKDQLTTVVYRDPVGYVNTETERVMNALRKMEKLTTLKLHPNCVVPRKYYLASNDAVTPTAPMASVADYFRQHLATTITIEIDYAMLIIDH